MQRDHRDTKWNTEGTQRHRGMGRMIRNTERTDGARRNTKGHSKVDTERNRMGDTGHKGGQRDTEGHKDMREYKEEIKGDRGHREI